MKERIKKFIEHKGINAGELATMLDVQRSNISHILNGRNKPGATLIEKLLNVFPDINARWLLTGKGEMLVEQTELRESPQNNVSFENAPNENKPNINVPNPLKDKVVSSSVKGDVISIVLLHSDGTFSSYSPK